MGDRLTRVDCGLQGLEDVLPADHHHRVGRATREQGGDTVAQQPVALVLQAMDLDQIGTGLGAGAETLAAP